MNNIPITDLSGYLTPLLIKDQFISIRSIAYSPETINPCSSGRFHAVGQPTYYVGSGNLTAMLEKDLDPSDTIPSHLQRCAMPSGQYNALDLCQYVNEHPEYYDYFYGKDGWKNCQELRNNCQNCNISGVYYDSQKNPGGKNLAIWPLSGSEFNPGYFNLPDN